MSSHRTIDELARQAAAVTREATERRAVPSADAEVFAARLRSRRTVRVTVAALVTALGIVSIGALANELLEPDVPVILDAPDREVVEGPTPPPAVIRDGDWEWDWALSRVTDPKVLAGSGPARVSGMAIPSKGLVVAVGVSPSLSLSGQPRPGVWVSRDAGVSWRAVAAEAIDLPDGHVDASVVINDVVASGPRLVAVGAQADEAGERGVVWISDDRGDTWQMVHRTSESASAELVAVETTGPPAEGPDSVVGRPTARIIAVGSYATSTDTQAASAAVWTSQDGSDWSQPQLLPDSPPGVTPSDVAADRERSSRLVVIGRRDTGDDQAPDGEPRAWISVNHGASWRAEPVGDDVELTAVVHVPHTGWLAVGATRTSATDGGDRDAVVYTSRDGTDWKRATDPLGALAGPGAQVPHAVTYGEGFDPYVVVGVDDGRPAIWVSPDFDVWRRLQSEELLPAGTRTGITAVDYQAQIIAIGELSGAEVTELAVWRSVSKESAGGSTGGVIAELSDEPPPIELSHDELWASSPGVSRDEALREFAAAAFGWDDPTLPERDATPYGPIAIAGPEGATVKFVVAGDDGAWTISQVGDGDFQKSSDGVLTRWSPAPLDAAGADLFVLAGDRTWRLELSGHGVHQRQVDLAGSGLPTGGLSSVLLIYRDDTGAVIGAASGEW